MDGPCVWRLLWCTAAVPDPAVGLHGSQRCDPQLCPTHPNPFPQLISEKPNMDRARYLANTNMIPVQQVCGSYCTAGSQAVGWVRRGRAHECLLISLFIGKPTHTAPQQNTCPWRGDFTRAGILLVRTMRTEMSSQVWLEHRNKWNNRLHSVKDC